ncbi:hypothetical protein ACI2JA_19905 [Alkalihalobacillus sp. NPDC078783]|uniref:hypothetical protein n=1 Tax=Alkalicoccobacillus gibsonii TaxID=79881 RepID=UPI003517B64C
MDLRWKKEDKVFDSIHEADVWADSLANEISARLFDAYDTPDYKIAYSLAFRLSQNEKFRVVTRVTPGRYNVWVLEI